MIIRKIRLFDFGIYSGVQEFDLSPRSSDRFLRPVVLFRGKNGVGKTTIMEAMRLCLYGALAIGTRVSQRDFEDYLRRRVHRGLNGSTPPASCGVELILDYIEHGKQKTHLVRRLWEPQGDKIRLKELVVEVDGEPLANLGLDEKEQYLRELVPPGIVDIVFFDGERIQASLDQRGDDHLVLDSVKSLMGLDMVEQLQRDVDVYITRQEGHDAVAPLQARLDSLRSQEADVDQQIKVVDGHTHMILLQIDDADARILAQEQRIASQGGELVSRREDLLAKQRHLEDQVDQTKRQVQELCSGLMPFALAPAMLRAVAAQLEHEVQADQARALQRAIATSLAALQTKMASAEYWEQIGLSVDADTRRVLLDRILHDLTPEMPVDAHNQDVYLYFSTKQRDVLTGWIEHALGEVPLQFGRVVQSLMVRERELQETKELLSRIPATETMAPLLAELGRLHRERGVLDTTKTQLANQSQGLTYRKGQISSERHRVYEDIQRLEAGDSRIHLASRMQALLDAYKMQLTETRVSQLEKALLSRFNQLCRKIGFIEHVHIDRDTLEVTLHRQGEPFSRSQLSAGENQLLAVAALWALRDVSGRPIPMVIDTPLSRLDSEHRVSMVDEFLPYVSHQVIVLATDAEIDDEIYDRLRSSISHTYEMQYDPHVGAMTYELKNPLAPTQRELLNLMGAHE